MGLRRLLKRLVKPAVMVGLVGTLSVSLIVTTPSNAQAFAPPVLPVVVGATELALPGLLSASLALHPVGWAIAGTVAVGVGLYATKDYWLPYVTGEFGSPQDQKETSTTTKGFHTVDYVRSGNSFALSIKWPSYPTQSRYLYFGVLAKCKNNSTTAVGYKFSGGYIGIGNSGAAGTNAQTVVPCPSTHTTLAWKVGGGQGPAAGSYTPNLDTSTAQPAALNGLSSQYDWQSVGVQAGGEWGSAGFDPRSDAASYRVEAECIAPDGKLSTITAESLGSESGIKFPSCEAAGKGHGTGAVKVFTAAPGYTPDTVLWETKRPTEDPATALCSPTRPTSGCKLGVKLDGQPCVIGSVECENWSSLRNDPNYSTRLSCQYGPYAVAIETCNPLERAYEPGGAPATEPNTDGNPATRNDAQPDGSTAPRTGTDPGLVPGGAAAGPVPGSTTEQAECFPSGWAMLNPIEWVMKPVGCALDSAFKPKKDLQTRLTGMQTQFANKVPVSWFGVGVEGASGGACPADWAVTFDGHSYSLICGTQADTIIRGFRPVLGSMLIMAMLWPFIRSLFYAAIPVFKVNPS